MAYEKLMELSQMEDGKIYSIAKKYKDIALVRRSDRVFAFDDLCSHDGGSISEGEVVEDKVVCPRHQAEFCLRSGEALCMPATEKIAVYPVRIIGDNVEVDWEGGLDA